MTLWAATGRRNDLLWGRCQGSSPTPYQTVVELGEVPAYSCTCPSRRFPCKHALALIEESVAARLPTGEPPPYAEEWLRRRSERAARDASAARAPGELADPAAAAKRVAARAERVAGGLEELERWLQDQMRGGLAGLERAGYAPFEAVAARMIDAQAPGVAGLLRALPGEIAGEGWPARMLDQLGLLHLLVQAHSRLDQLPPDLAATVRSRIGYPVSKDDVLGRPGVSDHWLALGMVDLIEYRLETRRVWLYGAETGRWALLLSFAPPGGFLSSEVAVGDRLKGTLHFYPGSGQHRALVGARTSTTAAPTFPRPGTLADTQRRFAELLAADPWATRMPAAIAGTALPPVAGGQPWRLQDESGLTCDVVGLPGDPWLLLACSAGEPVGVFGEWSPRGFRPLSVLPGGHGAGFSTAVTGLAA